MLTQHAEGDEAHHGIICDIAVTREIYPTIYNVYIGYPVHWVLRI